MKLKIIILGDAAVGKTVFINKLARDKFTNYYSPTIGAEVTPVNFRANIGNVKLELWEISGDQKYSKFTDRFLSKADGCLIMFDLTNDNSYNNINQWIDKLKRFSVINREPLIPFIICGTKGDLCKNVDFRVDYEVISSKSFYNTRAPLLSLIRIIFTDKNIYSLSDVESDSRIPIFRESLESEVELFVATLLGNHPASERRNALIKSIRTICPE